MRGFDAVVSLVRDYKWAIDIEICVFPQEGLTNYPETDELLVEGLKRGAKVLKAPQDYDYGLRDFDVADLDGNMIFFGMESKKSS